MITLTREEAQQVLDALENNAWIAPIDSTLSNFGLTLRARLVQPEPYKQPEDNRLLMQAYRAIHEKQPEPEPVAWMRSAESIKHGWDEFGLTRAYNDDLPLYTVSPQREWQGLTDKEILADEVLRYHFGLNGGAGPVSKKGKAVIEAVTSKLKEKNT